MFWRLHCLAPHASADVKCLPSRSPAFNNLLRVVSLSKAQYTGPSYNALRTTLLDKAKDRVNQKLKPFLDAGRRVTGFVLLSDGWTDAGGRPFTNYFLATPKGTHFLKAVDMSGNEENAQFIFAQLAEVMEEVGPEHIVASITDGAAANTAAARLLEEQ